MRHHLFQCNRALAASLDSNPRKPNVSLAAHTQVTHWHRDGARAPYQEAAISAPRIVGHALRRVNAIRDGADVARRVPVCCKSVRECSFEDGASSRAS